MVNRVSNTLIATNSSCGPAGGEAQAIDKEELKRDRGKKSEITRYFSVLEKNTTKRPGEILLEQKLPKKISKITEEVLQNGPGCTIYVKYIYFQNEKHFDSAKYLYKIVVKMTELKRLLINSFQVLQKVLDFLVTKIQESCNNKKRDNYILL